MTGDDRCTNEVRRRIALAKEKELLSGTISPVLKKRMIKVLVWIAVLYHSENTTLKKRIQRTKGF